MNDINGFNVSETSDINDLEFTVTNNNLVEELSGVSYTPSPVDKIRVVLYKKGEMFDSFSISTNPKSKLCKELVSVVGKIINKKNGKK